MSLKHYSHSFKSGTRSYSFFYEKYLQGSNVAQGFYPAHFFRPKFAPKWPFVPIAATGSQTARTIHNDVPMSFINMASRVSWSRVQIPLPFVFSHVSIYAVPHRHHQQHLPTSLLPTLLQNFLGRGHPWSGRDSTFICKILCTPLVLK